MRCLKLLIGLYLLPAAAGATLSTWELGRQLLFQPGNMTRAGVALGGGFVLWLVVFAVMPSPTRTYVLGHELTHAFWALLMGARVGGLRVTKHGGEVTTSKTNWFITLAPYFFPFYAMLFIALFFLVHALADLSGHMWILFLLIGLGWSFHTTFTLKVLFEASQPDVKSQGALFSLVIIYLMNLLVLGVTVAGLSPRVSFGDLGHSFGTQILMAYSWTLDKLMALWQHVGRWISQAS